MKFENAQHIHCIGIGGIGISAIAKLLAARGKRVTGSDAADSEIVRDVSVAGIKTHIGHRAENIHDAEIIIYSEAVPRDNVERIAGREQNIPEYSGAEALSEITRGTRLIAVAGTNGKSTTTALIGLLLEAGGLDPTVIVGSKVPGFPFGNVRLGRSNWFVLEADEYQAKFLKLAPEIAVVTNIEEDHLDYFRDLAHITETFQKFLDQVMPDGHIIINADDDVSMNDVAHRRTLITYGTRASAKYRVSDVTVHDSRQWFHMTRQGAPVGEFSLRIPGRFNAMNAAAALTVALELGLNVNVVEDVLQDFPGIWRRFERLGECDGAIIVSDYGHHPTAIAGTLQAARDFYPDRRLVLVFQPHHHHRTRALFEDFVAACANADVLILSEIYAVRGREQGENLSSQDLVAAVQKQGRPKEVYFGGTLKRTGELVRTLMQSNDLIIFMGAGDIDGVARRLGR